MTPPSTQTEPPPAQSEKQEDDENKPHPPFYFPTTLIPNLHGLQKRRRVRLPHPTSAEALTLSPSAATALRTGLGIVDMDTRWLGNLAASIANRAQGEWVLRLYRSWTRRMVYEGRYRPRLQAATATAGEHDLVLVELAVEGDDELYRSTKDDSAELRAYDGTVHLVLRMRQDLDHDGTWLSGYGIGLVVHKKDGDESNPQPPA